MVGTKTVGVEKLRRACVIAVAIAGLLAPAARQVTAQSAVNWTGAIRCEIRAQAPGYSHQETQTWTLTGAAPAAQGSVSVYPATWSVSGQGWHDRTRNASRRVAQWAVSVPGPSSPVSAPIGFTLHPTGGQFDVAKWHAQLTAGGGYTGSDQFINNGIPQTPNRLASTLYEWQFPKIEAATKETQLAGSDTREVKAFVGPLQPDDAQAIVSCAWALGRGSAPALPPPTMQPTPPPVSTAPGNASPGGITTTQQAPPAPTTAIAVPPGSSGTTILGPIAPGGNAAPPGTGGVTAPTAVDPANFQAKQTGEGTVVLTWNAVPGAGSYLVGGPGLNVGVMVSGTSHTVTGIPSGTHTWIVATVYNPGGVLTTADKWSRATTSVVNSSGRYRILLTGFRVRRPTFDDRVNGNGDEVYASAAVTTIDRRNNSVLQPRTLIRSLTYGDVSRDPQRVRAGSFSVSGGLWTGDNVPAGEQTVASASASSTRFPLTLWEGTLRDGIDAVVINPVLWEEDGQLEYYNEWANPNLDFRLQTQRRAAHTAAILDRATRADLTPFRGTLVLLCSSNIAVVPDCKPGNDRQIGINAEPCVGDNVQTSQLRWCELTIVATREAIEKALSSTSSTSSAPASDALADELKDAAQTSQFLSSLSNATRVGAVETTLRPAFIAIPLVEPSGVDLVKGGLDGSYELYLRVERLP